MARLAKLHDEVAIWSLDLGSRRVTRSGNHDLFCGYLENLPHWIIEHFMDHMQGDDAEGFAERMRAMIASKESFDFRFRVVWQDGTVIELRSYGTIALADAGQAVSVMGSTRLA